MQSRGTRTREVDWCQSAALLVRREAAERVGYLDPDFFVYSDEVDFAQASSDAGWRSLYVPAAVAVHHEQLVHRRRRRAQDRRTGTQSRPLYAQAPLGCCAAAVRWLTAWSYAVGALAALVLPGRTAGRYWRHVTATLRAGPWRGSA